MSVTIAGASHRGCGPQKASLQMVDAAVIRARGIAYGVPGMHHSHENYVVALELEDATGVVVEGIGEGQPRGALTGDSPNESWRYLEESLELLSGRDFEVTDRLSAVSVIQDITAELDELAHKVNHDPAQKRPYRGTMLGIEIALLDAFSQALSLPLYALLGHKRDGAPLMPQSVSAEVCRHELQGRLRQHFGWNGAVRIAGVPEITRNVDVLEKVSDIARSRPGGTREPALWLVFSGELSRRSASVLVREVALSMLAGFTSQSVVIQQPVSVTYGDHLPVLQRQADAMFDQAGREDLSLTIHGAETVWDKHSLGRLRKLGGLRSIEVTPAQAGGLLSSIELVRTAQQTVHDPTITLAPHSGGSLITDTAVQHLAMALPTVDGVSQRGYSRNLLNFAKEVERTESEGSTARSQSPDQPPVLEGLIEPPRLKRPRDVPGLGLAVDYSELVSDVSRFVQFPPMPEPHNEGLPPARYENVEDVRPLGPNGTKGYLLEKRALARGLSTTRYSKSAFVAEDGLKPGISFKWSRSPISSAAALSVCTHKEATRLMLEEAGVPTPKGRTFRNGDFDSARAFVEHIGFPVVVKPSMGIRGIGVVAGIENSQQLEDAFALMADSTFGGQDFIVEQHVNGRDHRILVVGGEVIAAIQRKPASLIGDGTSTIAELLIHRNVARRNNPHLWTRPAKVDATMRHHLDKLGLTLDSVLPEGREVMLSNTANISQGADSIDVFDRLHPSIIDVCQKAVAAIPGMQYCGVDFLLEDPVKPVTEQDAAIIELNAHAAIGNCEYPMFGKGRQVAQRLMDLTIEQYGLNASEPAEELTVHLTVRGKVTGVGFREWLKQHADAMGAQGWVRNLTQRTLEAVVSGPTERIAPLVASCIIGPKGALPTSYQATVAPNSEAALPPTFEVRERPKQGDLSLEEQFEIDSLRSAERQDIYVEKSEPSGEDDS